MESSNKHSYKEIFDKQGVMERVSDDKELLKELVALFFVDFPNNFLLLKEAIQHLDFGVIEKRAHFLKSALGNLGAVAAYHLAARLEKSGKNNSIDGLETLLIDFEQNVTDFKTQVDDFLKQA